MDAQMQNRLYVGNLARDVAASTLEELFEPFGFVMDVKLVVAEKAGSGLGFAFVTMATDESARAAARALDGVHLRGVMVKVEAGRAEGGEGRGAAGGTA
jgi:RNA recognition motif-containing protein